MSEGEEETISCDVLYKGGIIELDSVDLNDLPSCDEENTGRRGDITHLKITNSRGSLENLCDIPDLTIDTLTIENSDVVIPKCFQKKKVNIRSYNIVDSTVDLEDLRLAKFKSFRSRGSTITGSGTRKLTNFESGESYDLGAAEVYDDNLRFVGDGVSEFVVSSDGKKVSIVTKNGRKFSYREVLRDFTVKFGFDALSESSLPQTLRWIWYKTYKNWMTEYLSTSEEAGMPTPESKTLGDLASNIIGDYVKSSYVLTYESLNLEDISRQKNIASRAFKNLGNENDRHVIVFMEKDTRFPALKFGLPEGTFSFMTGHGYTSRAAIEEMVRDIPEGDEIVVITLTDYDPHGINIAMNFIDDVQNLSNEGVTIKHKYIDWASKRPEVVQENQYSPVKWSSDSSGNTIYWTPELGVELPLWDERDLQVIGVCETCGCEQDAMSSEETNQLIIDALQEEGFDSRALLVTNMIYDFMKMSPENFYIPEYAQANPGEWREEREIQVKLEQLQEERANYIRQNFGRYVTERQAKALINFMINNTDITNEAFESQESDYGETQIEESWIFPTWMISNLGDGIASGEIEYQIEEVEESDDIGEL